MLKFQFPAMGTGVHIGICTDVDSASTSPATMLYDVQQSVFRLERLMSRFLPDSDVSRINRSPGEWVSVSPETWEVLRLALKLNTFTDGLFHPCMGRLMEQMGYRQSFETMHGHALPPTSSASLRLESRSSVPPFPEVLEISSVQPYARIQPGSNLDLGGIAKAWIVSFASRMICEAGYPNHVASAGGDMICQGRNGPNPWRIGIENPENPEESLLSLDVESLSVATSGIYKRTWKWNGTQVHHILDPRTGSPASTDIASCTVLHENLLNAEALARSCLILGTEAGIPWLMHHQVAGYVVVTTSGEVMHTWNSFRNRNAHH